jgi:hypothetical protein
MKCTPECSVSGLTRAAQQVDHWPSRYIDCSRLVEKCTNNPRRRGLRSDTLRTRADAQVEAPNHHTIIIEIAARAKTPRICKSPGREDAMQPTFAEIFPKKKILSSSEKEQNDGRKSKRITISKMKLFRMSCWEEDNNNNNNKNDSNEIVNKKVIERQQDY